MFWQNCRKKKESADTEIPFKNKENRSFIVVRTRKGIKYYSYIKYDLNTSYRIVLIDDTENSNRSSHRPTSSILSPAQE